MPLRVFVPCVTVRHQQKRDWFWGSLTLRIASPSVDMGVAQKAVLWPKAVISVNVSAQPCRHRLLSASRSRFLRKVGVWHLARTEQPRVGISRRPRLADDLGWLQVFPTTWSLCCPLHPLPRVLLSVPPSLVRPNCCSLDFMLYLRPSYLLTSMNKACDQPTPIC